MRKPSADVERAVECLFHQAGPLRLVRHLEAGIEIRFQRKFMQQGQTECVDRADGDVCGALAHVAPQLLIAGGRGGALLQLPKDAPAHFCGGLACEREGKDAGRVHALAQQVQIALNQYIGLAGAGRCLEHNIVCRVHGTLTCVGIGEICRCEG